MPASPFLGTPLRGLGQLRVATWILVLATTQFYPPAGERWVAQGFGSIPMLCLCSLIVFSKMSCGLVSPKDCFVCYSFHHHPLSLLEPPKRDSVHAVRGFLKNSIGCIMDLFCLTPLSAFCKEIPNNLVDLLNTRQEPQSSFFD